MKNAIAIKSELFSVSPEFFTRFERKVRILSDILSYEVVSSWFDKIVLADKMYADKFDLGGIKDKFTSTYESIVAEMKIGKLAEYAEGEKPEKNEKGEEKKKKGFQSKNAVYRNRKIPYLKFDTEWAAVTEAFSDDKTVETSEE